MLGREELIRDIVSLSENVHCSISCWLDKYVES